MIIDLTIPETFALLQVMEYRYDNIADTRAETGDEEYDQTDEDQCSVLVFMLSDFDYDAETVASTEHLMTAIWVALANPEAFSDVDFDALNSAAVKIGYWDEEGGAS